MKPKTLFVFALFLSVVGLVASRPALAQSTYTGLNHINQIINNTPGVTHVNVSGGVNSTATGNVNVRTASGLTIPVPTSVTAKTSGAAIATAAARIGMRVLPWVGTALVIKELSDGIANSGWHTCPPPQFFCKAEWDYNPGTHFWFESYYGGRYPTASASCAYYWQRAGTTSTTNIEPIQIDATHARCRVKNASNQVFETATITLFLCNDTIATSFPLSGCGVVTPPPPEVPATESDLQKAANDLYNSDQAAMGRMRQKQKDVEAANPSLPRLHDKAGMPTTMSAPPVTSPQTTISTETLNNPDGSTSTKTISEQTTVTPTMGPSATAADPKITFPSTTTTTTTVVNNTTNTTTMNSETTVIHPAPEAVPVEMPTDYNREGTQLQILQQLDGSLAPDAPVDQEARVATKVQETDASLAAKFDVIPGEFDTDKALWFSWVWTPPVGACNASDFSGNVHGYAISFDICSTVEQIRDVLGWFFAILGAWAIYGQIFKRGD